MRKCIALAFVFAVVQCLGSGVAEASSGSISGGTVDPEWTKLKVDNMSVTVDDCGPPECHWSAIAGIWPTASGNCPSDWTDIPPNHVLWAKSSDQNGTLESGPQEFNASGIRGLWLCLYLDRTLFIPAPNPIDPGSGKPLCPTGCGYFEVPASSVMASKTLEVEEPEGAALPPPALAPVAPPAATSNPKHNRKGHRCPKGKRKIHRKGRTLCVKRHRHRPPRN